MKKKILISLLLMLLSLLVYSQNMKEIDWHSDLDFLAKTLPEKHINLFAVKDKKYFLSEIDSIKSKTKTLTNFEIAVKIQELIAKMGDAHTMLYLNSLLERNKILPIHVFYMGDGFYVLHTSSENKKILGAKILKINNIPMSTVSKKMSSLFTADNTSVAKVKLPQMLPSLQILQALGITKKNEVELELEKSDGTKFKHVLKAGMMTKNNRVSFHSKKTSFAFQNEKRFFADFYDEKNKIYLIQYNKCWSKELQLKYGNRHQAKYMPSFKIFEDKALGIIKSKKIEKFIFDLRFNGGGNSLQGTEFIKNIAKLIKAKNNKIKVYAVLGRYTFSSGILNALDMKKEMSAIYIGEESSGKPNHFGEVQSFQLPSSKLYVSYSTKYFKNSDKDSNSLKPEIKINLNFSDFNNGIDPIYEWIKRN